MSDTLQIFGKTYEGVTGLVAKDSSGADVVYTSGGGGGEAWTGTVTVVNKLPGTISSVIYFDQNKAAIQRMSLNSNASITFSAPLGTYTYGHYTIQYVATMFAAYVPSSYYAETPTVLEDGYRLWVGKTSSGICYHLFITSPDTSYGVSQTSVTIEIAMP